MKTTSLTLIGMQSEQLLAVTTGLPIATVIAAHVAAVVLAVVEVVDAGGAEVAVVEVEAEADMAEATAVVAAEGTEGRVAGPQR